MQFWQGLIRRSFRIFFITTDLLTQWVYRISKGALGHKQAGYHILLLTTIGRKSGRVRTHALLYLKVAEKWVVVASNGGNPNHPDWYFNLMNQPQAKVQVGKLSYDVQAQLVSGAERSKLWDLLLNVWPAYANYQAGITREIPIFVLNPDKVIKQNKFDSVIQTVKQTPIVVKSLSKNLIYQRYKMFIPIHRKTFLRDVAVIQAGFALFGFSIAIMIRSNLGTSPWAVFEVALSKITSLTPGTMSVIVGFVVLLGALAMKEKIGWGTIANILFIGPWEDLFLWMIPSVNNNPVMQYAFLLVGVLSMGMASAIYIGVDAGAGPRDSLMLAVQRTTGLSIRVARAIIELVVVLAGWLLGGPLGVGTLIFAILIGPAIQWGFKLFKVQPHKNLVEASV